MWIRRSVFILSCFFWTLPLCARFGINVFQPWDINLRPPIWQCENSQLTIYTEAGYKTRGINKESDIVSVMQIWTPKQDSIAMLKGFPPGSPETVFLNDVLMNPVDDMIRGNFIVTGTLDMKINTGFGFRYHFPCDITFGVFLPFYSMKLRDVVFTDLTPDTPENQKLINNLTSNLQGVINQKFDPNLNLGGWKRAGPGDLALLLSWWRHFPQQKPILKDVALNTRFIFTMPTGLRINPDDTLSIPFGFDGSFSIFFCMGITLNWLERLRGGIDFKFQHEFGNSRERRIKVDQNQTDFLFLAKVRAFKDFGFTQRYHLFLEAYKFIRGISARFVYEFWHHGEDKLSICTNTFSNNLANTAESLQDWEFHQFIFRLQFDFQDYVSKCAYFKPQLELFLKWPFNGKRAVLVSTVGAALTFNF